MRAAPETRPPLACDPGLRSTHLLRSSGTAYRHCTVLFM